MRSVLFTLALAASAASGATILGLGVEADYYEPVASGGFAYTHNGVSTSTRFNDTKEKSYQLGVYFEHPVPVLPNIRLDLTPEVSFTGLDGSTLSKVSINQTDITPYYEIVDSIIDLDLGVTFKVIDVKIEGTANQNFKQTIPMGYAAVGVDIPGTPIRIAGDVSYVEYNSDSLIDSRIKAAWKIGAGLEGVVGYRREALKIDNHYGVNADLTIDGPFCGLGYRF